MSTQPASPTATPAMPPVPPPEEYPRMLYKLEPRPKAVPVEDEEELKTTIVNDDEELKKKLGEGWSKDVPQPKAKSAAGAHSSETQHSSQHSDPLKKK